MKKPFLIPVLILSAGLILPAYSLDKTIRNAQRIMRHRLKN
jgi:hypothetical protein